jgi:phytanoyl-CoA hydroxylase
MRYFPWARLPLEDAMRETVGSLVSDEMIEHYEEHGYVVVPGLVPLADLELYIARLSDIVEGRVEPPDKMLVMKDVMVAKGVVKAGSSMEAIAKIQDYENDPVLDGYRTHPGVLDCVERFIGHDVMTVHTMLINKPPNVDGRHPLHQDLLYFPFRPPEAICASWTALEPVTKENGCLVVIPGSHKGELLKHENPDWEYLNGGYFGAKDVGDVVAERVHLEMDPGDTVFFHPVLLHGSGRNRTQGFRRAISAHYANTACTWEWLGQQFDNRHYKIVRGDQAGEVWAGERNTENPLNPLEYIPSISVLKDQQEVDGKPTGRSGEDES